ncbi:hypothetical protein ACA910_000139 [Epithemia clementina (nom. ined.)]
MNQRTRFFQMVAAILTIHSFFSCVQACPIVSVIDKAVTEKVCPLDLSEQIQAALGAIDDCVSERMLLHNRNLRGQSQQHQQNTKRRLPLTKDCRLCAYVGQYWFCYQQFCPNVGRTRDLEERTRDLLLLQEQQPAREVVEEEAIVLEMESAFAEIGESNTAPKVAMVDWESLGLTKLDNAVCLYQTMKENPSLAKCLEKAVTVTPNSCDV